MNVLDGLNESQIAATRVINGPIMVIAGAGSGKTKVLTHRIAEIGAQKNMGSIKALVALSPLLGLVGTVTGMVEVFDVMAITGSGNARAMAAGISKATLPTMAGLVTAVAGIAFSTVLERRAERAVSKLEDKLILM